MIGNASYLLEATLTRYDNLEFALRIVIAAVLGMLVGVERSRRLKGAGVRTHCIVALTASVFTIGDNGDSAVLARTNLLRIADSATATASTVNVGNNSSHAVLEVDGGRLDVSDKISVGASGRAATSNCVLRVADGTLNYGTIYLYCDGNELDFSNAAVTGTRIEMNRSSAIRLFNTHLTMPSGIFMMGDGNGSDAANNALKRDIYVGGTDTWVKVSENRGFWVPGSVVMGGQLGYSDHSGQVWYAPAG